MAEVRPDASDYEPGSGDLEYAMALELYVDHLEAERDNLRKLLRELHAVVVGECPALLDEDRGGNAKLALGIEDALQEADHE